MLILYQFSLDGDERNTFYLLTTPSWGQFNTLYVQKWTKNIKFMNLTCLHLLTNHLLSTFFCWPHSLVSTINKFTFPPSRPHTHTHFIIKNWVKRMKNTYSFGKNINWKISSLLGWGYKFILKITFWSKNKIHTNNAIQPTVFHIRCLRMFIIL